MIDQSTYLFLILILLILSAFFSGSETALFSLKRGDIYRLRYSKKRKDKKIASLMRYPQKILITILIGNFFANTFLSAIFANILLQEFPKYGHWISIAVVTPLIIIFCEITPKVISINSAEKFSSQIISLLTFFHYLFYPVRLFFAGITNIMIKILGLSNDTINVITEDELAMAVKMRQSEGVIGVQEGGFIKNVLRFSKKEAENVMIPRNEAIAFAKDTSIQDALDLFRDYPVVRVPVFEGDMDHIIGMIDSRDLIPYAAGLKKAKSINRLIGPIVHYPASKELGELLDDFLKNKIQLAVVIDEYGGTAGIVTLSSIISVVMGEEFAITKEKKYKYAKDVKKIKDNISFVSGDMQIDDYAYEFKDKIESSEAETISGYIIEQIGKFPQKSDFIQTENYIMRILKVKNNKIESIELIPLNK